MLLLLIVHCNETVTSLLKFYKLQLFAGTRAYLFEFFNIDHLLMCWKFVSIEVECFDKKSGKLIQQFGEQRQVLSKSNSCLYRK